MFKTKSLLISGISLLITIVMMVTLCSVGFTASAGETIDAWDGQAAESFAEGSGDGSSPDKAILIENAAQLYKMVTENVNAAAVEESEFKYYKIINDIYLNNITDADMANPSEADFDAKGFKPWLVGTQSKGFYGQLDGGGHTVYGLYCKKGANNTTAALIPTMIGGTVKNLSLKNAYVRAHYAAGGIVGLKYGSLYPVEVTYCSVDNIVANCTGSVRAGGIVAGGHTDWVDTITVSNCGVTNSEFTTGSSGYPRVESGILGYIGKADNHTVSNCFIDDSAHPLSNSTNSSHFETNMGAYATYTNVYYIRRAEDDARTFLATSTVEKQFTVLTVEQMTGEAAKTNMPGLDWTVWETTENGYPVLKAPEAPACTHANEKDGEKTEATYFTKGSKQILCADCGEFIRNDEIDYDTANPVSFDEAVLDPATNELTVKWEYSAALSADLVAADNNKALTVKYAFVGGKEYSAKLDTVANFDGQIIIEGINADRFNKELTVKLEFAIGDYNTEVLNGDAIYTVAVNTTVSTANQEKADAYTGLINAIANATEAVVEGAGTGSADFTAEDSSVDIKAGTATFKFVATKEFFDTVKANGTDNRTVKLVVTVDGEEHEVTINQLKTSIKVTIKGLSFEQMYGSVSAKLVITYSDDSSKNIDSKAVSFNFADGIDASENTVAVALEALLKN